MARRRVFRTRVRCPELKTDLGYQAAMRGRAVALQKASASDSEVCLLVDGAAVGSLDASVGAKVASAIDRGQSFAAVIEKAYPAFVDGGLKRNGASLDIKVEYFLEKGQPAIETESCWRCVDAPESSSGDGRSFFTTIAGVTFEGRQRIVARCSVGERLTLIRDPGNAFDAGAIKVVRSNGEQVGFIPSHVSRNGDSSGLSFRMDRGDQYFCRIKDLTGGGRGRSLGVNIEVRDTDDFPPLENVSYPSESVSYAPLYLVFLVIVAALVIAFIASHP